MVLIFMVMYFLINDKGIVIGCFFNVLIVLFREYLIWKFKL